MRTPDRYCIVILIQRLLFGFLSGVLYDWKHRILLVLIFQFAYVAYIAVKNPYKHRWNISEALWGC